MCIERVGLVLVKKCPLLSEIWARIAAQSHLITLTINQLQDLITEATLPLQDRIESLEATITHLTEDLATLRTTEIEDIDRL